MLKIKDLEVQVGERKILKGISLDVKPGEIHAIMGTNGSGKSTLANILSGKGGYEITGGSVTFEGEDLLDMDPEERAAKGVFMAFQYPVELPGVLSTYFLRTAYNSVQRFNNKPELTVRDFNEVLKQKLELLHLDEGLLKRAVNEGFSGGEKKRNEIFQMAVLGPKLAILDETDSGLDIDALQIVADGVQKIRTEDPTRSAIVITHYQRILNYIVPDKVHVMLDGKIVRSGGKELALELEEHGYNRIREEVRSSK